MSNSQINECRCTPLVGFVLFCLWATIGLCDAQETGTKDAPLGVLKLEGSNLDYIELFAKDGHTERITRPNQTIELPPGKYRLQQVRLKGGYTYYNRGTPGYTWTTVAADMPATMKVGAPLIPTVKVQREGRILRFSYELRGEGGETYTGGDRSKPPTFAVYKGKRQVASGQFEFG